MKRIIIQNLGITQWENQCRSFSKRYSFGSCFVWCDKGGIILQKDRKDIEKHEVIELNRLWIDDKLKKNAESILISKSIKLIKKYHPEIRVIQSFADGRLGCGTIYQASNFGYYGFHETEFFEDKESGRCYHEMVFHFASRPIVITRNLEMMQNRFRKFITRTYRYLYLIDKQIDVLYQEQEYVKEGVFKEYLDWQFDAEEVDRQIKNCLKYHFSKLGKPKLHFLLVMKNTNTQKKCGKKIFIQKNLF